MSAQRSIAPIIRHRPLLDKLLQALLLLNLVDMLLTLCGVELGIIIEANPLMRWCLSQGAGYFVLVKTLLCFQFVLLSFFVANKFRHFLLLTFLLVFIYSAVVIRTIGMFL